MLTYLAISNLAVIARLELELEPGLTVITGETGAGKSMLMAGLTALLGDSVDPGMVRDGADELTVQGAFSSGGWQSQALLDLVEDPPDGEVIVRRTVKLLAAKRDRLYINDRLVGRQRLYDAAADLVSLASQHEYVALLKRARHIHFLDAYAGHQEILSQTSEAFEAHQASQRKVEELEERTATRIERLEVLEAIIGRLEEAAVEPGEEAELLAQIGRLSHAVDITRALQESVDFLYESDHSLLGGLDSVGRTLGAVVRYEPALEVAIQRLDSSRAELEDLVGELRSLLSRLDVDPGALEPLQERVALLQKLKRRFGVEGSDELVAYLVAARLERDELADADVSLDTLRRQRDVQWQAYQQRALALHASREAAAAKLCQAIQATLGELAMPGAQFEVSLAFDAQKGTRMGADRVEFLFTANPGQPPRPLAKVASGGELSRILLAFKAVLAAADPVPTYVFDEIDAGVGGRTALAVGRLLSQLAAGQQVLCITHTAQLAAFADQHIVVSKVESQGSTVTQVTVLKDREARAHELARMLSGLEGSQTALENARELLAAASAARPSCTR